MPPDTRFTDLRYADFRRMALDPSLSHYEKIGFPDSYRAGCGEAIFADICRKLTRLDKRGLTVLDIGCGCSDLPRLLIDHCRQHDQRLILIDAPEMLALLPKAPFIRKIPACYPDECPQLFSQFAGCIDVILTYSVLQIVFAEGDVFSFLNRSLGLLADGGQMLVGDLPNASKRRRFFSSPNGVRFHQHFMQTNEKPDVDAITPENGIDDGVLLALLSQARLAGFDSYLLPQSADLPLANRREDLLICKP
ncbi:MAG: SAM-dependent methyltransferase [Chloroflexota bacterium]